MCVEFCFLVICMSCCFLRVTAGYCTCPKCSVLRIVGAELMTCLLRAGFLFFQLTNRLANCQLALTGGLSLDVLFNSSVT